MSGPAAESAARPVVWALLGDKVGDNAQVLGLCRALGQPFVEKRLDYGALRHLPNWLLGATFKTLRSGLESLQPPWPDLVVAVGQRSAPVARAVKRASGGRTRLVQLGRPRAPLAAFDLVLTTPQYGLPQRRNVVVLDLPIGGHDEAMGAREAAAWRDRFNVGSRGALAVLVGGETPPHRFDDAAIARLAEGSIALARDLDVEILVTCGRRLPAARARGLRVAFGRSCAYFHVWSPQENGANPYRALLGLASAFIVSTDSVSMMADAVRTGRPVHLFEPSRRTPLWARLGVLGEALSRGLVPAPWREAAVTAGLVVPQRDTGRVVDRLLMHGLAVRLGAATISPKPTQHEILPSAILAAVRRLAAEGKVPEQGGAVERDAEGLRVSKDRGP